MPIPVLLIYDIKCTCRSIDRLNTNENEAKAFLEEYNTKYGALLNAYVIAAWNYETNLTDENANQIVHAIKSNQLSQETT